MDDNKPKKKYYVEVVGTLKAFGEIEAESKEEVKEKLGELDFEKEFDMKYSFDFVNFWEMCVKE